MGRSFLCLEVQDGSGDFSLMATVDDDGSWQNQVDRLMQLGQASQP